MKTKRLIWLLSLLFISLIIVAGCQKQLSKTDLTKQYNESANVYAEVFLDAQAHPSQSDIQLSKSMTTAQKKLKKIDTKLKKDTQPSAKAIRKDIKLENSTLTHFKKYLSSHDKGEYLRAIADTSSMEKQVKSTAKKYFNNKIPSKFSELEKKDADFANSVKSQKSNSSSSEDTSDSDSGEDAQYEKERNWEKKGPFKVDSEAKTVTAGNFKITFKSATLGKDDDGKDMALISYELENTSNETMPENPGSVLISLAEVKQDGDNTEKELTSGYPADDFKESNPDLYQQMQAGMDEKLLAGKKGTFVEGYDLDNTLNPIKFEIKDGSYNVIGTIELDLNQQNA